MEGIQLSVETTGAKNNISVIKVGGYIDTTTSAELEHSLDSLLKAGSYNIIIDLGNVDYISSAGWGIFISEIKGIREKGGDLKLVRMIPDVYEVFELLEFHYILKAFDTLEEAVEDFDKGAGVVPRRMRVPPPEPVETKTKNEEAYVSETVIEKPTGPSFSSDKRETIEDKIRKIVIENPESGSIKITKLLKSPRFGNAKISWFQVRNLLKKMNLDTKEKRIKYFKQVTFR